MPHYTALVTVLAILFYFYTGARVPGARQKFGLKAPVMMSGQPEFDRIFRVQLNTLEWMPIFLPLLVAVRLLRQRQGRGGARSRLDRRPHPLHGDLYQRRR